MKSTALGALVAGTGWLAILIGFVQGSLAPATVGLLLVAGVEAARWQIRGARVQVTRDTPRLVQVGERFSVTTNASSQGAAPLWVRSDMDLPLRLVQEDHHVERGGAQHVAIVEATEAGTAIWTHAEVRLMDPWGLHERSTPAPAPGRMQVSPEDDWVKVGRRAGRRRTIQALSRARKMSEALPEIESVRLFQPGDRLRDIDWARSSRMPELHSRVRERVASRPVTILLDASASMRYHRRRAKITTAARVAYGLASAAQAAGVHGEIVVIDETGVSKLTGRGGLRDALLRLGQLDAPIPADEIPQFASSAAARQERGFLGAVSLLARGKTPSVPPMDAAVAAIRRSPDQALVVAILDGETDPLGSERAVRLIRDAGQDVVLVLLASGAHHVRGREAGQWRERLEAWALARKGLQHRLYALGVPVIVARPDNIQAVIEEVSTRAQ